MQHVSPAALESSAPTHLLALGAPRPRAVAFARPRADVSDPKAAIAALNNAFDEFKRPMTTS